MKCKYCGSELLSKCGKDKANVQRYVCKSCRKYQRDGDKRFKFTQEERRQALILYCEGNGFRRIARILSEFYNKKFANNTILNWIKQYGNTLEEILKNIKKEVQNIDILEMDELHTYVKKNNIK